MSEEKKHKLIETDTATAILPAAKHVSPITVIGTPAIRETFDDNCLQQAVNCRLAPGVSKVVLNPDGHVAFLSHCGSRGFGNILATGRLVYFISHNIARKEIIDNRPVWVHRKGATRAFPAGHHALKGTVCYQGRE